MHNKLLYRHIFKIVLFNESVELYWLSVCFWKTTWFKVYIIYRPLYTNLPCHQHMRNIESTYTCSSMCDTMWVIWCVRHNKTHTISIVQMYTNKTRITIANFRLRDNSVHLHACSPFCLCIFISVKKKPTMLTVCSRGAHSVGNALKHFYML